MTELNSFASSPGVNCVVVNPQPLDIVRQAVAGEAVAGAQLSESIRLRPDFAEAHNSLGVVLMRQKRMEEAVSQFTASLRLRPDLLRRRPVGGRSG